MHGNWFISLSSRKFARAVFIYSYWTWIVLFIFDSEHILQNKNFYIGEIGHTVVDLNGPSCECGKRGCLQTYISDTWLINNARFLFENVQGSIIKTLVEKPEDITLDVVYNAYRLGDGFIIEKLNQGLIFNYLNRKYIDHL